MNTLNITRIAEKVKFAQIPIKGKSDLEVSIFPLASARSFRTAKSHKYQPIEKAEYLLGNGRKMTAMFSASAYAKNDAFAMAKADCLAETYRPENIFISKDLINYQTGELYDGYGVLQVGVASRISPAYQKYASRRARKRTKEKIDAYKLTSRQDWRFATFTLPHLKTDVATVLKVTTRAMELLKKRKFWIDNVDGAFFGEEMTVGDGSTFYFTHYHVHTHVLILGRYVYQWKLADFWTDCVEKACAEFGVEFLMRNLESNRLMVDIRSVKKYAKKHSVTMDDALLELHKYTTKGSDFEKVPEKELLEIEYALSGRQMVKSYGIFNERKGTSLSKTLPLIQPHTVHGSKFKPKFERRERKVKSLVKMGRDLILEGKRDEWLRILRLTMQTRREYRRNYLAVKYRYATFATLDGVTWSGVSSQKYYGRNRRPFVRGERD
jgi:hypothetical protein